MARKTRSLSRLPVLAALLAIAVAAVVIGSGQGSAQEPAQSPAPSPEEPSTLTEQVRVRVMVWGRDITRWFVQLKSGPPLDSGRDALSGCPRPPHRLCYNSSARCGRPHDRPPAVPHRWDVVPRES